MGSHEPEPLQVVHAGAGPLPASADEVALDQATGERAHLKLGEQIEIAAEAPVQRYTIVGILKFAAASPSAAPAPRC